MASFSKPDNHEADLLLILEDCLNNYESDAHLFQSPLATWEVVRCRLSLGVPSTPEQLAVTVRAVLDELIDALYTPGTCDLNSPAMRRFIIADHLYRRGMKQSEICRTYLPLSKSQFYRERSETLTSLAGCVLLWEKRARETRKLRAAQRLAKLSHSGDSCLVGVGLRLKQLTSALTSDDEPNLIVLSGQGGSGKTALARSAAAHVLARGQVNDVAVVTCQAQRFSGTEIQPTQAPALTLDELLNQLIDQLRPASVSEQQLFDRISAEAVGNQISFDEVLSYLSRELDEQHPNRLTLTEKMQIVTDLLWANPTLIILDGFEGVPDSGVLIENLRQIVLPTHTRVLITSRARLSDVFYIRHIDINGLAEMDSIQLLRRQAAEQGTKAITEAPEESLMQIVRAAGGNPLVLRWIANQLTSLPVATILSDVTEAPSLSTPLLEFIYRRAWEGLSEPAQQLLVTIANAPASEASWEALQRKTGLKAVVLNTLLKDLVKASFIPVSETLEPTYYLTSLTRTFVVADYHNN